MNGWRSQTLALGAAFAVAVLALAGPLIRKVYEVDPLTCSQCGGQMKVFSLTGRRGLSDFRRF